MVGFNATYGAKYFGGYARSFKADGVTPRDMPNEALRNLKKQIPNILDIEFICSSYLDNEFCNLKNALIYCDPPYYNTTKYNIKEFDTNKFWDWCRMMDKNNYVYVSEYNAPEDFECIWEKETTTSLKVKEHEPRIERLFRLNRGD